MMKSKYKRILSLTSFLFFIFLHTPSKTTAEELGYITGYIYDSDTSELIEEYVYIDVGVIDTKNNIFNIVDAMIVQPGWTYTFALSPGEYVIKISADGYIDEAYSATVTPGGFAYIISFTPEGEYMSTNKRVLSRGKLELTQHNFFLSRYNSFMSNVKGYIRNAINGNQIAIATVILNDNLTASVIPGIYLFIGFQGEYFIKVTAPGFLPRTYPSFSIGSGEIKTFDLELYPIPGVTLSNAISILKMLARVNDSSVNISMETDFNESGNIELGDVIYILQCVSGLRAN